MAWHQVCAGVAFWPWHRSAQPAGIGCRGSSISQQGLWELLQAICPDYCHLHIQQLRVDVSGYDSGQRLTEWLNDLQLALLQLPLKGLRLQRADPPRKRSSRETWGDSTTLGSAGDGASP